MTYSIIGAGSVGRTLASFFAKADVEVALANGEPSRCWTSCRGAESTKLPSGY
jgi:predicted dinucleotide-binding enzyme